MPDVLNFVKTTDLESKISVAGKDLGTKSEPIASINQYKYESISIRSNKYENLLRMKFMLDKYYFCNDGF